MQALEKSVEAGGALDQYEIEGPDRAELLQDLAEFQLAAVSAVLPCCCTHPLGFWPLWVTFHLADPAECLTCMAGSVVWYSIVYVTSWQQVLMTWLQRRMGLLC